MRLPERLRSRHVTSYDVNRWAERCDNLRHRAFTRAMQIGACRERAQFHWRRWEELDRLTQWAWQIGKQVERVENAAELAAEIEHDRNAAARWDYEMGRDY